MFNKDKMVRWTLAETAAARDSDKIRRRQGKKHFSSSGSSSSLPAQLPMDLEEIAAGSGSVSVKTQDLATTCAKEVEEPAAIDNLKGKHAIIAW